MQGVVNRDLLVLDAVPVRAGDVAASGVDVRAELVAIDAGTVDAHLVDAAGVRRVVDRVLDRLKDPAVGDGVVPGLGADEGRFAAGEVDGEVGVEGQRELDQADDQQDEDREHQAELDHGLAASLGAAAEAVQELRLEVEHGGAIPTGLKVLRAYERWLTIRLTRTPRGWLARTGPAMGNSGHPRGRTTPPRWAPPGCAA